MLVEPGKLNKRITLQKYVIEEDAIKNQVKTWVTLQTLWAAVNGLYGAEYWAAANQGQKDTITFTVRWCALLEELFNSKDLTGYRICFRGVYYDIQSYDNINFENKLVKIKAVSQ